MTDEFMVRLNAKLETMRARARGECLTACRRAREDFERAVWRWQYNIPRETGSTGNSVEQLS